MKSMVKVIYENEDEVSLKIKNYGGVWGWYFKKIFPRLAAFLYIQTNFLIRRGKTKSYIKWFLGKSEPPKPMIVEIETINRCNSTCEFCPANKNNDKRPFAKLSDEDFKKIIADLKEWGYHGMISLYINNEPLIDTRIVELHKYVRKQLPECRVKLFTNGTLMTLEMFRNLISYVDYLVINNYSETMALHQNIKQIVREVQNYPQKYAGKEIVVNIRYIKDVLTNRAGEAPNKKGTKRLVKEPCIMPFTDLAIFSNGNVGICCNDATEKTSLGNIRDMSLKEIWENQCQEVRLKMKDGRDGIGFCKYCDTMDSGFRLKTIYRNRR